MPEMWFLRRVLKMSWTAKRSTKKQEKRDKQEQNSRRDNPESKDTSFELVGWNI